MKFVKKLKDHIAPDGLKIAIHRNMVGHNKPHPIFPVHASDVTKPSEFCPREFALMSKLNIKPAGFFIGTSQQYTFDLGRAMEGLMQNRWALPYAVGDWKCDLCGAVVKFSKVPKVPCGTCGQSKYTYKEVRFTSEVTGITGGVDLIVALPGKALLKIVELKSIDKDLWIKRKAPEVEHRLRTSLYLRLIDESNDPKRHLINTKTGIVLYMMKGFGKQDTDIVMSDVKDTGFSPFKEFDVPRDDSQIESLCQKAIELKKYREDKGKIPKQICTTALDKRANSCNVKKQCFSGKY